MRPMPTARPAKALADMRAATWVFGTLTYANQESKISLIPNKGLTEAALICAPPSLV